jgi:hypothetical protein
MITRRPPVVGGSEQRVEVVERTEQRIDIAVVGDVVPGVGLGGDIERREPECIDLERSEIVQVLDDTAKVADAVTVGVGERARVDLVDHGIAPPITRRSGPRLGRGLHVCFFRHFGSKS